MILIRIYKFKSKIGWPYLENKITTIVTMLPTHIHNSINLNLYCITKAYLLYPFRCCHTILTFNTQQQTINTLLLGILSSFLNLHKRKQYNIANSRSKQLKLHYTIICMNTKNEFMDRLLTKIITTIHL